MQAYGYWEANSRRQESWTDKVLLLSTLTFSFRIQHTIRNNGPEYSYLHSAHFPHVIHRSKRRHRSRVNGKATSLLLMMPPTEGRFSVFGNDPYGMAMMTFIGHAGCRRGSRQFSDNACY